MAILEAVVYSDPQILANRIESLQALVPELQELLKAIIHLARDTWPLAPSWLYPWTRLTPAPSALLDGKCLATRLDESRELRECHPPASLVVSR
jgi:hypothetical protein